MMSLNFAGKHCPMIGRPMCSNPEYGYLNMESRCSKQIQGYKAKVIIQSENSVEKGKTH